MEKKKTKKLNLERFNFTVLYQLGLNSNYNDEYSLNETMFIIYFEFTWKIEFTEDNEYKLGTMETKTENNTMTMTNDDLMMMTNIQLVERNYNTGYYYDEFMSTKQAELLKISSRFPCFPSEKGFMYFYTKQALVLLPSAWYFQYCYDSDRGGYYTDTDTEEMRRLREMRKSLLNLEEIKKNDVCNFYTFYTSSGITCMITGIVNKHRFYDGEEYFDEVPLYIHCENIDFCGKPCILTIDDFTEDFKTKSLWIVSENDLNFNEYEEHISLEDKVRMMAEMNNQKHQKNFETQNQVQEQSKLIASLQQQVDLLRLEREVQEQRNREQMTLMRNQLREQSKLIDSLQSHLVVNKKEVEVDMFSDWLND